MIYLTEFGNLLTRLNSTVRTQYGVESVLCVFLAQGKPVSNQEKPSFHTVPEVPEYGGVSWIELVCLRRKLGKLETGHQVENQTGGNCGSSDRSISAADMTSLLQELEFAMFRASWI